MKKLGGHLWLNADVLEGPGALLAPMDALYFVQICAETLPEAVMSLSWGSSVLSATRHYTIDMVERMITILNTEVPRPLTVAPAARLANADPEPAAPAAVTR